MSGSRVRVRLASAGLVAWVVALSSVARAEAPPDAGADAATPPTASFPEPVELPPQPPRPLDPEAPVDAPSTPAPAPAPAPRPIPQPIAPPPAWPPPYPRDEPETERRGYGGQILLVDGASLVIIIASGGSLAAVGGLGYVLGPPIVHAAHGHAGKPFASLGLRVGLPIGGAFLGCAAEGDSSGELGCLGGAAAGFALGIIAAIVVDAAVIANEDVPRQAASRPTKLRISPRLAVTGQSGQLGLFGQF